MRHLDIHVLWIVLELPKTAHSRDSSLECKLNHATFQREFNDRDCTPHRNETCI